MSSKYSSTYGVARGVSEIVSLIGWVLVVIGAGLVISLIKESGGGDRLFSDMGGVVAVAYLLVSVAGLLLVTLGQITRATLDTADNTGHVLFLIKGMVPQGTQSVDQQAEDYSGNGEDSRGNGEAYY